MRSQFGNIPYIKFFKALLNIGGVAFLASCNNLDDDIHENSEKKNVLFIISDDMRTELNCYGHKLIQSPNIDKLASQGVVFTHAYTQQAVCSASRASLLTGCRPETVGVDYPYSEYFVNEFLPSHPSISSFLFENGYYARTFGKIHHGYADSLSVEHYDPHQHWLADKYALPENKQIGFEDNSRKALPPFEAAEVADTAYPDGKITLKVVEALREAKKLNQPFYFGVGFFKPHLPFNSPKKYWDMYNPDSVGLAECKYLPENSPEYAIVHYTLEQYNSKETTSNGVIVSDDYARQLRHAYFAAVSYIDTQVGIIMDELEKLGLRENTIIVFIGDHGWHLGDQGMWGKTTNYENSTLSPLIISDPRKKTAGKSSDALVEYVDIFPTIAELCNLPLPEYLEGTSMIPLLEDPGKSWKKAAFSRFPRGMLAEFEGYAIRTPQYRYVEWRDNETGEILSQELFDHQCDPLECENIAYKEENIKIVEELSKQLNAGWKNALPERIQNFSDNPTAPPAYAWGPEGESRRKAWEEKYNKK